MRDRAGSRFGASAAAAVLGAVAILGLTLAGCTRAIVPLSFVTRTPPGPTPAPTRTPGPTFIAISGNPTGHPYAVVWVPAESSLPVQQPAGIPGLQVGTLAPDQRGIYLTGNSTLLGSSLWVEVLAPGLAGWVNSWYLTEDVSPADFCTDPQVVALLDGFGEAILSRDGRALASMTSPRRGLAIRYRLVEDPHLSILCRHRLLQRRHFILACPRALPELGDRPIALRERSLSQAAFVLQHSKDLKIDVIRPSVAHAGTMRSVFSIVNCHDFTHG